MTEYYLAIDAGTSSVKAALFDEELKEIEKYKVIYPLIITHEYFVELDFNMVLKALIKCVKSFGDKLKKIRGIGLSVLCPGLVLLDKNGDPLCNAIIHLDRRSTKEALYVSNIIGEHRFLSTTGNLPFPGGISLTSILWLKNNAKEVYKKTYKFGHTNTFLLKKMTDAKDFYIDPTNASFTGLYNTVELSGWAEDISEELQIETDIHPSIIPSYQIAGYTSEDFSLLTGIRNGVPVVIGAADTSCAVFGSDLVRNGDILNTTGTVEAVTLTIDKPYVDRKLLLRAHALKNKWLSMYIIGAGGASFEWARNIFFKDMKRNFFYDEYLPQVFKDLNFKNSVKFKPYLCGDRLSISQKNASFLNLSLSSTREDIVKGIVLGMLKPIRKAIEKFSNITDISDTIYYTGQGSTFLEEIKKKYFSPFNLIAANTDAALTGAVKLLKKGLEEKEGL